MPNHVRLSPRSLGIAGALGIGAALLGTAVFPSAGTGGTTTGPAPTCQGQEADFIIEPGEASGGQVFLGTQGDDVIVGSDADDSIRGLQGDDLICGGDNEDDINGGKDDDDLYGEGDNDLLRGRQGRDHMYGDTFLPRKQRRGQEPDICRGGNPQASQDNAKFGDVAINCEIVGSAIDLSEQPEQKGARR